MGHVYRAQRARYLERSSETTGNRVLWERGVSNGNGIFNVKPST
jgi:hypothetical protein